MEEEDISKIKKKWWHRGYNKGVRIRGGRVSFEMLLDTYDRLRREHNKRVKDNVFDERNRILSIIEGRFSETNEIDKAEWINELKPKITGVKVE